MLSLRRPFLHYPPPLHCKTLTLTPSTFLKFDPEPQSNDHHINNMKHILYAVVGPRRSPNIITAVNRPPKVEEQKFSQEGSVTESLRDGMFRVQLDNGDSIIGYISGKIRKNFIKILPGDRVKVEVTRYDTSRGRIITRIDPQKNDPNKKSKRKGLKKRK